MPWKRGGTEKAELSTGKKKTPEGVFFAGAVNQFTVTKYILGASFELCVMVTFFFMDHGRI